MATAHLQEHALASSEVAGSTIRAYGVRQGAAGCTDSRVSMADQVIAEVAN